MMHKPTCRHAKKEESQCITNTLNLSPRIFYINRCLLHMVKDEALGHDPRLSGTLAPIFQFEKIIPYSESARQLLNV